MSEQTVEVKAADVVAGDDLVVLAYSGGLDTSCILVWLRERGYKVVAFMADVGQKEDFEVARQKALNLGALKVIIADLKHEFITEYIWPAIQANAKYEERYLLGTSFARPCIAKALVKVAKSEGACYMSHGCTGKGNDQLRFELACYFLHPSLKVIAPWRMPEFYTRFAGRPQLFEYAELHKIPLPVTPKESYSIDANIMHVSYEDGSLEDPSNSPPENMYRMTTNPQEAPNTADVLHITFDEGVPVCVQNANDESVCISDPVDILVYLNKIGGQHGCGRIDVVENRCIGIKSRGVYESPGCTILHNAHVDLELYLMDKEMWRVKRDICTKFADQVYNGLWYSPECEYSRRCIALSQVLVSGTVTVSVYKGQVQVMCRGRGTHSHSTTGTTATLYCKELASMSEQGDYEPTDADGFINTTAVRLKAYGRLMESLAATDTHK